MLPATGPLRQEYDPEEALACHCYAFLILYRDRCNLPGRVSATNGEHAVTTYEHTMV